MDFNNIWKSFSSPILGVGNKISGIFNNNDSLQSDLQSNSNINADQQNINAKALMAGISNPNILAGLVNSNIKKPGFSDVLQDLGDSLIKAGSSNGGEMVSGYYVPKFSNALANIGGGLAKFTGDVDKYNTVAKQNQEMQGLVNQLSSASNEQDIKDKEFKVNLLQKQNENEIAKQDNALKNNINLLKEKNKTLAPEQIADLELKRQQAIKLQNENQDKEDQRSEKIRQKEGAKAAFYNMIDAAEAVPESLLGGTSSTKFGRFVAPGYSEKETQLLNALNDTTYSLLGPALQKYTGPKTDMDVKMALAEIMNPNLTKQQLIDKIINNAGRFLDLETSKELRNYYDTKHGAQNNGNQEQPTTAPTNGGTSSAKITGAIPKEQLPSAIDIMNKYNGAKQ